jgi:hypothetical protein
LASGRISIRENVIGYDPLCQYAFPLTFPPHAFYCIIQSGLLKKAKTVKRELGMEIIQTDILIIGGGGALYQRHDNPVRITGDGYALAFH